MTPYTIDEILAGEPKVKEAKPKADKSEVKEADPFKGVTVENMKYVLNALGLPAAPDAHIDIAIDIMEILANKGGSVTLDDIKQLKLNHPEITK